MAVRRDKNSIIFDDLNHPAVIGRVLYLLHEAVDVKEYRDMTLDFSGCEGVFPNVAAPLAGILEYYASEKDVVFQPVGKTGFLDWTHFLSPLVFTPDEARGRSSLNTVWKFGSSYEVNALVNAIIGELEKKTVFKHGVLEGIDWCLNEVMDNVLQHSDPDFSHPVGYVMVQLHGNSNNVVFCVCDYGQGIQKSLQSFSPPPTNSVDAITRAIQEGVTRDKTTNQGNGLWGLHNILRLNKGQLRITSGEGAWFFDGNNVQQRNNLQFLAHDRKGTVVDFQVNAQESFSIAEALNGHTPTNLRLEALEDDKGENIVFRLKNEASGTGTRQSGQMLRNKILNAVQESPLRVVIDFEGIPVIASSFADELIGKLVVEFGFVDFMQRVQLKNMNDIIAPIVNRSVAQRMGASFGYAGNG